MSPQRPAISQQIEQKEALFSGSTKVSGKIAVLGAGRIGGILLESFLRRGIASNTDLLGTMQHAPKAAEASRRLDVPINTDNPAAARAADVILLCVKPQGLAALLEEIRPELTPKKLLISVVASATTSYIESRVGPSIPVMRAMPNTPATVGCGITAICKGTSATDAHMRTAQALFSSVGRVVAVEDAQMDAVTGLSACGPAYIYIILESLAEAGVKVGLPRELATQLAAQTALGSAQVVLQTGNHPALLKDDVTTPGGCTIDGLLELEEGRLRVTLIKAVVKATQRARELLLKE
ncbi:MAG: pyrroline-5-carboxylate reductase [Candidatus Korobacteraceae bacterium]